MDMQSFDLSDFLGDVITLMNSYASKKDIDLRYASSGPIPKRLFTDRLRLRQILMNLIGNAIKFTDQGFVMLELSFETTLNTMVFRVKDTGCGIKPNCLEWLFQPFSQGNSSISQKFGGTGLGLYLSRKLAQALQGSLALEYTEIGKGTIFKLTLPIDEHFNLELIDNMKPSFCPQAYSSLIFPNHGLENSRILVVEDGRENLELFTYYLSNAGATVDTATDGHAGIEKVVRCNYDLVFMDLQMPIMDGYEAIQILRKQKRYRLPVVALTAHAMRGEREKCLRAGFNEHISKPVSARTLVDAAQSLIAVKRGCDVEPDPRSRRTDLQNADDTLLLDKAFQGDMPAAVQQVVQDFLTRIPDRITTIEKAFAAQDYERVRALLHSFKGSAGTCGFSQLFHILNQLEDQIQSRSGRDQIIPILHQICQTATSSDFSPF